MTQPTSAIPTLQHLLMQQPVASPVAQPAATAPASAHLPKLKFTGSDRFIKELRRRVDAYFEKTGKSKRDCPKMYFKTATILAWFFAAYFLLLFVFTSWLQHPT
jgi:hypothetical protein